MAAPSTTEGYRGLPVPLLKKYKVLPLLSSTKANWTHVYFTNMWSRHCIRLVCMWLILLDAGSLTVRVEGVAVSQQHRRLLLVNLVCCLNNCESNLPYELRLGREWRFSHPVSIPISLVTYSPCPNSFLHTLYRLGFTKISTHLTLTLKASWRTTHDATPSSTDQGIYKQRTVIACAAICI